MDKFKAVEMSDEQKYFELAPGRNIENMSKLIKVPLGIAGPINGYQLPLATTEGALVASVNRGCKAIRKSKGAEVKTELVGATRGPVLRVKNLNEGRKVMKWVEENLGRLKKIAEQNEKHLKLLRIKPALVGRRIFLRLEFDTEEAMGMNMVTIATELVVKELEKKLKVKTIALSGNYCVDKKPSWLNFIKGRGRKVWAEAVITNKAVKEILKSSPEEIVEVVRSKQWLGSMMSGSMGFNAHFANVVAAMFLATGQDMAHVVEASMGVTTAEIDKKGLYFSIYLPSLMVGTIGGGTGLPVQKKVLKGLGLGEVKKGDSDQLAKIIGLGVLAGELSLTAALASGDLAKAHQRLGRGK
ncbi:MAG: hydroxymethylglutaryl-CoA reductase [Patescibacteria group bacterium]|nr:hydroxymethylglutaryl-CoA reductase [Patescibacteria group bacterium]